MDVSVLIPVGSDVEGLAITLASIRAQGWDPARVEVIVCNDGGGDAVSALAAAHGCREARLDVNSGSFAARNAGLALARGDVLAFLDADESLAQGWLEAGLEALREADYVGGRVCVDAGARPSFWERIDLEFAFPVEFYLRRLLFAPTANLFVARRVFEAVGGFDEALRSGGDREFGVRVARHGFAQRYCPGAATIHPARGLREQLRKARRTAVGTAHLEVSSWRRPAGPLVRAALRGAVVQLANSARFVAMHAWRRGSPKWSEIYLLTSARLLLKAYSLACLAVAAAWLGSATRVGGSRIPAFTRQAAQATGNGGDACSVA